MRNAVRTVSWVLVFASLGAAGAAWFTPTPEIEAEEAVDVARLALDEAGIASEVERTPRAGVHETEDGREVDAWFVVLAVDAGGEPEQIELRVQRSAGRVIYVDDRIGPDDTERLLTQEQFEALGDHRDDSRSTRWVARNLLAALSAAVIAGASYVLATRSDPLWSTP